MKLLRVVTLCGWLAAITLFALNAITIADSAKKLESIATEFNQIYGEGAQAQKAMIELRARHETEKWQQLRKQ